MATPSLADMNNDGRTEELVIPISYFYEEDDYRYNHLLWYNSILDPNVMARLSLAVINKDRRIKELVILTSMRKMTIGKTIFGLTCHH